HLLFLEDRFQGVRMDRRTARRTAKFLLLLLLLLACQPCQSWGWSVIYASSQIQSTKTSSVRSRATKRSAPLNGPKPTRGKYANADIYSPRDDQRYVACVRGRRSCVHSQIIITSLA